MRLGEGVVAAAGDPVDLVQVVQGRDPGLDAGPAAEFDLERQDVQQTCQVVGVGRVAALLLDPDAACQHVPR